MKVHANQKTGWRTGHNSRQPSFDKSIIVQDSRIPGSQVATKSSVLTLHSKGHPQSQFATQDNLDRTSLPRKTTGKSSKRAEESQPSKGKAAVPAQCFYPRDSKGSVQRVHKLKSTRYTSNAQADLSQVQSQADYSMQSFLRSRDER